MALSNAERQARYRKRLKTRAHAPAMDHVYGEFIRIRCDILGDWIDQADGTDLAIFEKMLPSEPSQDKVGEWFEEAIRQALMAEYRAKLRQ